MTRPRILLAAACVLVSIALGGCNAVSAVQTAAAPLDSYELTALRSASGVPDRNGAHLRVELPTASGTLASDRIAIKPSALQVQYLPGVRWVDEANAHVRMLLMRSLSATDRFALVTGDGPAPLPDYVLLGDLEAFQAELVLSDAGVVVPTAVVRMTLSLVDDAENRLVATRTFARRETATADTAPALVAAMDRAMTPLLRDVADWAVSALR